MKCKKCGANLPDTDKFCDQCGWKVVKEKRCPECGAALREGTKFCPKCGVLVESAKSGKKEVFMEDTETSDIPIGDIEQNILSETERELHTVKKKRPASAPKKNASASEPKKSVPAPEPPKKKKKPAPAKKKAYEERDEEDEEEDAEDGEDAGGRFMLIMTVAMAVLIVALAVPFFFIVKSRMPIKNYGESVKKEQENEADGAESENSKETEPEENNIAEDEKAPDAQVAGTLSIVSNVNVRDNPSKEGTNIIKVAKAGETYEYLGTAGGGGWYAILLEDGSTGYVFAEYVSVD